MIKKILLSIIFLPILILASSVFISSVLAKEQNDDSVYLLSETSFEYSESNDSYVYPETTIGSNQNKFNKFFGFVWTATGDVVNVLKNLCGINDFNSNEPLASVHDISQSVFKGLNENVWGAVKILGHGKETLIAAGYTWTFLMTLTFGIFFLSLWFLRLSTGVSPPAYRT